MSSTGIEPEASPQPTRVDPGSSKAVAEEKDVDAAPTLHLVEEGLSDAAAPAEPTVSENQPELYESSTEAPSTENEEAPSALGAPVAQAADSQPEVSPVIIEEVPEPQGGTEPQQDPTSESMPAQTPVLETVAEAGLMLEVEPETEMEPEVQAEPIPEPKPELQPVAATGSKSEPGLKVAVATEGLSVPQPQASQQQLVQVRISCPPLLPSCIPCFAAFTSAPALSASPAPSLSPRLPGCVSWDAASRSSGCPLSTPSPSPNP